MRAELLCGEYVFSWRARDLLHRVLGQFILRLWILYVYLQTRILHLRINLPLMLGQLQLRGRGALLHLQRRILPQQWSVRPVPCRLGVCVQ